MNTNFQFIVGKEIVYTSKSLPIGLLKEGEIIVIPKEIEAPTIIDYEPNDHNGLAMVGGTVLYPYFDKNYKRADKAYIQKDTQAYTPLTLKILSYKTRVIPAGSPFYNANIHPKHPDEYSDMDERFLVEVHCEKVES